jgi:hypothetical protein
MLVTKHGHRVRDDRNDAADIENGTGHLLSLYQESWTVVADANLEPLEEFVG